MFENHQRHIAAFGRASPDNMARVLKFVVVTIQNRLFNCVADMETLTEAEAGGEANGIDGILYGHKRQAYDTIEAEKEALYFQAEAAFYNAETTAEAAKTLIALFAEIPGLGPVKAGFAVQLLYGQGAEPAACLDSHNLERFGINLNRVRSARFKNAKRGATKEKFLNDYLGLCEKFGGTARLWDSWCHYLAERDDETGRRMNGNKAPYDSAYHVSALHCEALGLDPETGKELGV